MGREDYTIYICDTCLTTITVLDDKTAPGWRQTAWATVGQYPDESQKILCPKCASRILKLIEEMEAEHKEEQDG